MMTTTLATPRQVRRPGLLMLTPMLLLAAATIVSACGGGKLNSDKQGSVRLLNATTEYETLDLVSGITGVVSGVARYAASGYAALDTGSIAFALRVPGSGVDGPAATVSVVKDGHTALLAYVSAGALKISALSEDDSAPSAGRARLRILNTASAEAGAVDLYVVSTATSCSALAGTTTPAAATGLSVAASTAVEISAAAAGSGGSAYNLCAFASNSRTDLRLGLPNLNFTDQQVATLVLTKAKGGTLLNGLLLNQQGSLTVSRNASARVRVAAGLPSAGAVSATSAPAGGAAAVTLASGLLSPDVGGYQLVTAGDLGLTVNGVALARSVEAGSDLTLLVTGSDAASVYTIDHDNTPSASADNPVRLRLLNGAAGAASLTVDGTQIGEGVLTTGQASATVSLPAASGTATLAATAGGLALTPLTGRTLLGGKVYSLFLLNGNANGAPALVLRADR